MKIIALSAAAAFVAASSFAIPSSATAEGLDGTYRGNFVCEKLKQSPDILRAPFDMIVNGRNVIFARPVFNRNGTRVVGSELGSGSIDDTGTVQLKSAWSAGGFGYEGSYSGAIKGKTGTLSGMQSWKTPQGGAESRNCTVAFVQRGS
jgi:hypothetical protein